jgi:putative transposase
VSGLHMPHPARIRPESPTSVMSRPLRLEVPGGHFHVTARANDGKSLFVDDDDRCRFLDLLRRNSVRLKWVPVTYCLMGNHYHLLVQTREPNLAAGMRDLNGRYARHFNARHGRVGHVFEGRYRSSLIQTEQYLLAASRYIAMNPVRAGIVRRPDDWPWSAHRALVSGENDGLTDPRALFATIARSHGQARREYARVVASAAPELHYDPRMPIAGDAEFIRTHAPSERPGPEILQAAWEQQRPSLEQLATGVSRDEFFRRARFEHFYTLNEIAHAANCSRETVRRRLRLACADLTPMAAVQTAVTGA